MNPATAHLRSSDAVNAPTGRPGAGASRSSLATDRLKQVWRGPDGDPSWARPALFGLLIVTAAAYFYNLTASGWANSFYSAAAQAGSVNWEAFLFGSSDAANSITVDKPPAALWLMALSVRVFGLNSFAILMPQVLMGVGAVAVVYATVKRYFSAAGGLIAGAVLALTPVAVLMFRFNNPDALLTLLMALGGWATMRAIEKGSARWMIAVGAFIGFGFLTKTFQVFLVVPFFGIAYLVAANTTVRRRILGAAAGLAAMVVSAGWWVAIVSLTPASMRPYVGGSQDNSFWNLTFGYNGFGRLSGNETGSVGGGGGGNAGGQWGTTGITRMFGSEVGAQISWLIPTALILLGVGLVVRGRRPRTDLRRAFYLVWGGWLIVTGLTFSFMAGIFHQYYTVALAPAVATIVGAGAIEMWQRRHTSLGTVTMAVATAAAATWSFILLSRVTAYGDWLRVSILAVGMAAAFLMLAIRWMHARFVPFVVAAALVAGLAGPTAYTVSTLKVGHTGSIVVAGPSGSGMGGGFPGGARGAVRAGGAPGGTTGGAPGGATTGQAPGGTTTGGTTTGARRAAGGMGGLLNSSTPNTEVVAALQSNASKYTWAAAAIGSQNAAGLQLGSGEPVMAIGGFNGSDPSPTLAQFQAYAKAGKIHYFLASSGGGMGGSSGAGSSITSWVEAHYKKVTIGSTTFYDLTEPVSAS
ncbi:glycosyltransferase family 39 protein [Allobranchiibius sp. CTAmp26]|uniref:ArnT family glycosyltransferase n=1 Tax=Allobranchiibius sp. CTAmp26 TaxID=2815214 RepID=UPI001AA14E29|nr:glycosyltransferase family 39 protein [Allobranchiibius sp. CTAmp26]MBO1754013.1 glycosyltransferase family 39 protein [Allobranchiibius sp. CTAmp26]